MYLHCFLLFVELYTHKLHRIPALFYKLMHVHTPHGGCLASNQAWKTRFPEVPYVSGGGGSNTAPSCSSCSNCSTVGWVDAWRNKFMLKVRHKMIRENMFKKKLTGSHNRCPSFAKINSQTLPACLATQSQHYLRQLSTNSRDSISSILRNQRVENKDLETFRAMRMGWKLLIPRWKFLIPYSNELRPYQQMLIKLILSNRIKTKSTKTCCNIPSESSKYSQNSIDK